MGKLEILAGINIVVLSLKSVWRQNSFFISFFTWNLSFLLLSPSADWMNPTYIMKGNLLY